MEAVLGLSGFFAAASLMWVSLGLIAALLLGGIAAMVFFGIFFGMNRLALAASVRWDGRPGGNRSEPPIR